MMNYSSTFVENHVFFCIPIWIHFVVVWVYTLNCMSPHAAVCQGALPKAHGSRGPAEKGRLQ